MSEGTNSRNLIDPTELWKQWYETSTKVWSNVLDAGKEPHVDPYGLYSSWLKSVGDAQEQIKAGTTGMMDPQEFWKQWIEMTTEGWRKIAQAGGDPLGFTTHWMEMMEEARASWLTQGTFPTDPFTFFKQWYDATSEIWSKVIGDLLGTEKFVEASSRFLESYTSFYATWRHASEEFFRNLQLPTRSDLARVAQLVVSLEEKVDAIEDAFEDFEDRQTHLATSDALTALEGRLDQVENRLGTLSTALEKSEVVEQVVHLAQRLDQLEGKLDKVLTALEKVEAGKQAQPPKSATAARRTQKKNVGQEEVIG